MRNLNKLLLLGFLSSIFLLLEATSDQEPVRVGVIIDGTGDVGRITWSCMKMALLDFYQAHESYKTRLEFHFRDAQTDIVLASAAALDLMENEQVDAIIGPEWSTQGKFIIELGRKARVPIISFAATSPLLSTKHNPYFVRTGYDDTSQVKAISAIVEAFGWREVSLIYEDTEYGNGLIPYIADAFQQVDIRVADRSVISPSSQNLDNDILKLLPNLWSKQTRVFLVHMTALVGSRFFFHAKESNMFSKEFVWIVTDGLSSLLTPVESNAIAAMEGVVGVRPHISTSKQLNDFKKRWKNPPGLLTLNSTGTTNFNVFGLWAYDTVFALATGVEKSSSLLPPKSSYLQRKDTPADSVRSLSDIRISKIGPMILHGIRDITIKNGLSGKFDLINGQLQPSTFEVFNVVGSEERVIGYWSPEHGLSKNPFVKESKQTYSTSKYDLDPPIWPGRTSEIPKGWVIPGNGKIPVKIGVPVRPGFKEFFNIEWDDYTKTPRYSGFANDVFVAVLEKLPFPFPYKFVPFQNLTRQSNGTYDQMLMQIKQQIVDAVVGDTTIVARRAEYVDFTLPYSESGVSMLVLVKEDERQNMWIFLKPLHWDLWLTTVLAFFFTAIVVWVLEHRKNDDFKGSWNQKIGLSLWFSFSTMVFAHRERILNNWTRLVMVVWVFVVLILTQSYTASLASYLTVQQLQPKYMDVEEIRSNHHNVGYQKNTFVKEDILMKVLRFDEKKLVPYDGIEQYYEALNSGKVAAIFDEIPYIRLFLAKYCNKFTMVGPTYKTDGFGFAFRQNSPLVPYFSRAILAVTQDKNKMDEIEHKNNLIQSSSCQAQPDNDGAQPETLILTVKSFGGLFIITAAISLLSIFGELVYSYRLTALTLMRDWYQKLVIRCSKVMEIISKKLCNAELVRSLERRNSRINPLQSQDQSSHITT